MELSKLISQKVVILREREQKEVLDFVEFLLQKTSQEGDQKETDDWNRFSLTQAMAGIENDNPLEYTEADLKQRWK